MQLACDPCVLKCVTKYEVWNHRMQQIQEMRFACISVMLVQSA